MISLNYALLSKMTTESFTAVCEQMLKDLRDYYARLGAMPTTGRISRSFISA